MLTLISKVNNYRKKDNTGGRNSSKNTNNYNANQKKEDSKYKIGEPVDDKVGGIQKWKLKPKGAKP